VRTVFELDGETLTKLFERNRRPIDADGVANPSGFLWTELPLG
jgi:hypothetical protein